MTPRYIFGLWRVPMYEYYWGHTRAQIALIVADQPITVFKKHDQPKPGKPGHKPDARKLREATEKWKRRKAEREKNGFSLRKLLSTGEKTPLEKEGE